MATPEELLNPGAPAPEPKPEPKKEETPEWVSGIKQSVDGITEKVTSLTQQVDELKKPAEEPEPETEEAEGWQPQTWDDIPKLVDERAQEIVEKRLAKDKEDYDNYQKETENQRAQIDKEFDLQLDKLEKASKIPTIKDDNDDNDPGRLARREIFGLAIKNKSTDLEAIAEDLDAHHKGGYSFDSQTGKFLRTNTPAAGQQAPVASSNASGAFSSEGPDYKTIHNLSMDELARRFSE